MNASTTAAETTETATQEPTQEPTHYTIKWTEVSQHEVTITAAEFKRITEDAEDEDDRESALPNGLADLDDDGFEFLTRENIEVDEHYGDPAAS